MDILRPEPIIVTLVHGTSDTQARWTDEDSKIRKGLTQEFGDRLYITKLQWSGENREDARLNAAKRLFDHINANATYFPSSPHVLVGHSHGGNIIRWALEQLSPTAAGKVAAAITISTPFVEIQPRAYIDGIRFLFLVWRVTLTFVFGLGWLAFFANHYEAIANLFGELLYATNILGIALLVWIPVLLIHKSIRLATQDYELKLLSSLEARQKLIMAAMSKSIDIQQPFLCIFTKADEVNFLFRGANRIIDFSRIVEVILTMANLLYLQMSFIRAFKNFFLIMLVLASVIALAGEMAGRNVSSSLLSSYGIPLIIFGFLLSVAIPIAAYLGTRLFGTTKMLDLIVVDISTTMKPVGIRNLKVSIVTPADALVKGTSRYVHTRILYGDQVASEIVAFFKEILGTGLSVGANDFLEHQEALRNYHPKN